MKRLGKVVAIGNQKGGVGKSTISSLMVNFIHNKYPEYKVLLVDADDFQKTLFKIREQELIPLSEEKEFDEEKLYRIICLNSVDFPKKVKIYRDEYDFIFIDLPGNLKQAGVADSYGNVDHLFIPTQSSKVDIDSTLDFIDFVNQKLIPFREKAGLKTTVYGFFNRVVAKNKDFRELYLASGDAFKVPFLENFIPESAVTFQRYISTVYSYENSSYGGYEEFCNEVLSKMLK